MKRILRCKNVAASFNRRSAELKTRAVEYGMRITSEWTVDGLDCFHAETAQATLKAGLGTLAEAGACINGVPRLWFTIPGGGRINETAFLPMRA
ncbi:hypothetical protein POK33_39520 [Burkholderia cenocepacia]|uniref:hypothetical protein n=1 Tax=Burkholderia cenocepacia TaxID=95486 RepID=UPI0023B9118F|nr:hypothetical protein [Burkholderia cenocepacia]MDF0506845.1 hypothetical protein [Burkholderia cenocepacia]